MKYALFSVPVGTIYDLPQPIKEGETGPVSTIGDEGLYGQACQVRTAPGGVTAAGVHLAPDVAEVVSFYGYHGYVFTRELQFIEEAPLRDYLAEPMVLAGRATDVLNLPKVQGVRMMELERGGLVGLNYCSGFLDNQPEESLCRSTVALMAKHAAHFKNVGGIEILGLGSDFDGIGGELEMDDCSKLPLLAEALRREGFTEDEVERVFYRNAQRFFEDNL